MNWVHLHTWHYLTLDDWSLRARINDNLLEWVVQNIKDEVLGEGTCASVELAKKEAEACILTLITPPNRRALADNGTN